MQFDINKTIEIIERTPSVLFALLQGISDEWIHQNEGDNTWSVFDVVGHLIECEKTDFIPRTEILLSDAVDKIISPLDMYAHFENSKGKSLLDLLHEFEQLRKQGINKLISFGLTENDLQKTATHPKIGRLSLSNLLAKWAAHDLSHLAQISRVMAKQYKEEVGPFITYLRVLS